MQNAIILLIEDNDTTRNVLKKALTNEGFTVLEATDGTQAIQLLQEQVPDLIIQDVNLSDVNGFELNDRIKALPNYKDIPMIALLGFLSKEEEIQNIISNFTAYLIKPVDPSRLLELVKTYLPKPTVTKEESAVSRVLIADDDPTQLKLLTVHLKHAGFIIDKAIDGNDAWQQIEANPPDAIVSDILMPGLDGFELCMKVRQDPRFARIPIILISSQYLEKSDRELSKKVGANAFVTRTADLKETINKLITNLKSKPTPVISVSEDDFKEEHIQSLVKQLERQVYYSTRLAQRGALQNAQLSLLKGLADAISNNKSIAMILQETLSIALDAAGISTGLLYAVDADSNLIIKQAVGNQKVDKTKLEVLFQEDPILNYAIDTKEIIQVPSPTFLSSQNDHFLQVNNIQSALVIPLLSAGTTSGLLVLGSNRLETFDADYLAFAQALGKQMAQTIELAVLFEHLLHSETRYRTLMDKANCGIMLCKRDGTILEINKEFTNLIGTDKENILGKKYDHFVMPDDREYVSLMLRKLKTEKNVGPSEGRLRRVDGSVRDVEYSLNNIKVGGEKIIFTIFNDVTERNRLRSQSKLSDKLATLGTLATGIVHEINNPLSWLSENITLIHEYIKTLQRNLTLLLETVTHSDKSEKLYLLHEFSNDLEQQLLNLDEMVTESINGAKQVRDIVRNLKGFSRIDEESAYNVDIHEVIDAAIKMAHHEFKYHAKLEKDYATNIPPMRLQASKLQQVFINLIVNAAQAMPKDKFRDNRIMIKTYLSDDFICIVFKDTGLGIDPDILPKIFDPFFTTKPAGIGTGLGLPICQDIVRSLGGEIKVESEPGKGSTFILQLPLHLKVGLATKEKPLEEKAFQNLRILVVDDEPSLLKTLQHILESKYQVITALGGRAALDVLIEYDFAFDLVVTDLNMPDIGGMDLYRFVAEKHPGLEKNMVFISGGLEAVQYEAFLAEIKNSCIEKPFTREELLRKVENIITTTSLIKLKTFS